MTILAYKNPGTRDIAESVSSKSARSLLPVQLHRLAFLKLALLNSAETLEELASVPGLRLEKHIGRRKGQYSIRINQKYRICFEWNGSNARNVEIVDYH